jgi:hypothetical protein
MTTTSIRVFGEIENSANRALAYAILAAQAAHAYVAAIRLSRDAAKALEDLIRVLTPDSLAALSVEQKKWLTARLQEIHCHLATFARSADVTLASRVPVLGTFIQRIQDGTEDLGDIIEDLVLVDDVAFRNLIAACTNSLGTPKGEPVGRMQN